MFFALSSYANSVREFKIFEALVFYKMQQADN